MKEQKFRVWDKVDKKYYNNVDIEDIGRVLYLLNDYGHEYVIEQYTGLKDKNGKEIYENCELDGRYIVEYIAPSFIGRDIINGDIIELYDNKFTITKEHGEVSQNSERSID